MIPKRTALTHDELYALWNATTTYHADKNLHAGEKDKDGKPTLLDAEIDDRDEKNQRLTRRLLGIARKERENWHVQCPKCKETTKVKDQLLVYKFEPKGLELEEAEAWESEVLQFPGDAREGAFWCLAASLAHGTALGDAAIPLRRVYLWSAAEKLGLADKIKKFLKLDEVKLPKVFMEDGEASGPAEKPTPPRRPKDLDGDKAAEPAKTTATAV